MSHAVPPPVPAQVLPPPPPAPPRSSSSRVLWWVLGGVLLFVLLVIGAVAAVVGGGWLMFSGQARAALQADPVIQEHLGTIRDMSMDFIGTGKAEGSDEFVFRVEGTLASGTVRGQFISDGPNNEILADGVLTLADGRQFALPSGGADAGLEGDPVITDDSLFAQQARAAVQRYPETARHLGRIQRFSYDDDATMAAGGALTFVFNVVGSEGSGMLSADFITVDADTDRLGAGTLTLTDGRVIRFDGEPPMPGEDAAEDVPEHPGQGPFEQQARAAVQRYPLTAEHLGRIERFVHVPQATADAPGMETFGFDVTGSAGSGRIVADFITVDADTERLGPGVLTLSDGREIRFDGEAPFPQESAAEAMPENFAPQDSAFVRQATAALRTHPQVRRHLGDLREARIDREASWSMRGDGYAFDLVGSRGSGRIEADFITVDEHSERVGDGALILADGSRIAISER